MNRILSAAAVLTCIFALASCKGGNRGEEDEEAVSGFATAEEEAAVFFAEDELEDMTPVDTVDADSTLVYSDIEVKPKFNGGTDTTFQKWVAENIKYPQQAIDSSEAGTVLVQFTVDTTGALASINVIRSVSPALDAEAVRVIEASPEWKAGSHKGSPVEVSYMIPVKFSM